MFKPTMLCAVPILLVLSITSITSSDVLEPANTVEILPSFWERLARERIAKMKTFFSQPDKPAKNVILFLGDGMGLPTVSAGRFFKAEVEGRIGDANPVLDFEDWPFHTLCRTYDLHTVVTDSASSATAYLGGTKTTTGILGLTGAVRPKECRKYSEEEMVESVLAAAVHAGKATGIVTTARITHASPAGAYAHAASRYWESDRGMSSDCDKKADRPLDIARQLVEENPNINVMIGGGSRNFYPKGAGGNRKDGRFLANDWLAHMQSLGRRAKLVNSSREFTKTNFTEVDYLLGILDYSHMPYEADREREEASLTNMTTVAIEILSRQPNGFFLFVEGARIDHAHHDNLGKKALLDMLAFEEAIREGTNMVDLTETLVIVTADHSHSFHLVGQPSRSTSLLDLDKTYGSLTLDEKGLTPLVYSSGPTGATNTSRVDLTSPQVVANLHDKNFAQPTFVPLPWSTHGGEDVGLYAIGIFSHLFHSTVDNTFVAQAMKYAMCLRPFEMEPHCSVCAIRFSFLAVIIPLIVTKYNF
ncbi:hypothetical protein Aperf_G00000022339 [Anoplocephala perfoliata]